MAGIVTFILGSLFAPLLVRIIRIPLRLLAPLIMLLAVIGAYAIRNNIFDVYIMLGLGIFVFLIRRLGFHPGPIGLGLILGPIIEPSLVQAMYISDATSTLNVFYGHHKSYPDRIDFGLGRAGNLDAAAGSRLAREDTAKGDNEKNRMVWGSDRMQILPN